jgi:PAS domain S-box-containing protein
MLGASHHRSNARSYFLAGALGLGAFLVVSVSAAFALASALRSIDHANQVQSVVDEWMLTLSDVHTGVRGYIVTDRAGFVETYKDRVEKQRAHAVALRALVADNEAQTRSLETAIRSADAVVQQIDLEVERVRSGHRDEARALLESGAVVRLMDRFRYDAGQVRAEEQRLLEGRRRRAGFRGTATVVSGALFAITSLALLAFAWRSQVRHERALERLALEARERLRALGTLAEALSNARTVPQVVAEIVRHGHSAARGDTCTLYLLNKERAALELVGSSGVAPEVLERIERLPQSGDSGAFANFEAGRGVWVETEAQYVAAYPELAKVEATGERAKAFWSVPLVAEGRPLGLLGVGFFTPQTFSVDERAFVETLANQCAQALQRASRLEREDEAQRWFGTTLRSIGDAVIATDPAGRVTFMNAIAEKLTGWTEPDALGQLLPNVFCILSEASRAPVESPVAKVLREGKVVGLANHTVLRPKAGREIPIDDSGAPIFDEHGKIVGVVLVFRDVSHEKRVQARAEFLAHAGESLGSSLDYQSTLATVARSAVPQLADWCGVDLVDATNGKTRQVAVAHADPNKVKFAVELGARYPPDPNATSGVPQVIRSGKSELYAELPQELLEAGARDAEHRQIIRELDLKSAMVVALRAHGRTFGAMSFVYAGSDRRYGPEDLAFAEELARRAALAIENSLALKEAEDARARERWLRSEAERANHAKDEFLATVSHELRTPLNAILGWTLTLRARKPPEEIDKALVIVERNARAQAKLIEDVLDVSRIISGKLALNLGPTNVAAAARAAIETISPTAEAKGIALTTQISDEGLTITADADRLQQVVWNLLSNAVKFTPQGGKVALAVSCNGPEVLLQVTDNGEGIRPENLGPIFEAFQQADASTTRRHGGLGLGLSIVKQLVFAHGGTVRATSDGLGRGSSFIVRLPLRASVTAARTDDGVRSEPGPVFLDEPSDVRLDGLRVLIVDDEEDALGLLTTVLHGRGATVNTASSVAEALEQFERARPDVIVSDIGMPMEDGYSLIKKIRGRSPEQGGRTPAVALTAYARPEDAQRAFAAGFQVHVTKPLEPARLASVVANLGGRSL